VQVNPAHQHVVDAGGELPARVVDHFRLDGRVIGMQAREQPRSSRPRLQIAAASVP